MRSLSHTLALTMTLISIQVTARASDPAGTADTSALTVPTIFIDCGLCDNTDFDFFKTNLTFATFVRDRADADVYVLITTQSTGSGGSVVTINMIGQRFLSGMSDTLTYISEQAETDDSTRNGVVNVIELGLIRFVQKSPLAKYLHVSYDRPPPSIATATVVDKWDSWVFSVEASPWFNGEHSRREWSLWGQISARRVTKDMKTNVSVYSSNYSKSMYPADEPPTYSHSRNAGFDASNYWSLTDHWSIGAVTSLWNSTWSNTESSVYTAGAVEYNIYPYNQSTRRLLRIGYRIGSSYKDYSEETIYDKLSEWLVSERLSASLTIIQPFGSVSAEIIGLHYFHDFDRNLLQLNASCSIRVVKGFSVNFNGYYSRTHDQLSLPRGTATEEEISSQLREIATSYRYSGSISLSYSFGSMYNNVVNARFGN